MQIAAADPALTVLSSPLGERSSPATEAAVPVSPAAPASNRAAAAFAQTSGHVTLSAASQAPPPVPPAPVYAEIWRDGRKVAQIDIHGTVSGLAGQEVASGGSGLAGPLLAAQRVVQVARQTGGEIRVAGQALDGQTLLMRARLAKTYSAV